MSLKLRFFLLLAGLTVVYGGAILLLQHAEQMEKVDVLAASQAEESERLDRWLDLTGVALQQFVDDYSWWDDTVDFVHEQDPDWAENNLEVGLDSFHVSAIWWPTWKAGSSTPRPMRNGAKPRSPYHRRNC